MQRTLQAPAGTFEYVDIGEACRQLGRSIDTLPYVHRVLLENLARNRAWGAPVAPGELQALVLGEQGGGAADLPLYVGRVILPDSSGLPALQDLAALRDAVAQAGGDAKAVEARIPVDLIVDHSLQVDHWRSADSQVMNLGREFKRNNERYRFLKWAQQAFRRLNVYPPGTGIIHQVNLERIATVVDTREHEGRQWAFPDFVIGGDSHTPMVNALGVLGWGVGGIDAEAAMLGQAYTFPRPHVVGVRLTGRIAAPALTTDAALLITERLRRFGVAGDMVEFFGPAVAGLTIQERATMANMAPEYGATCGFFPVDEQTLRYLRSTNRSEEQVALVEAYCRANHLWRGSDAPLPAYDRVLEIDLGDAAQSMAGPRRPQDRMPLADIPADFNKRLQAPLSEGGFNAKAGARSGPLTHGSVVLAAITSCTNTSNPTVMLAAGLVARKAVERGLKPASWVKTSMAPGSRVVTQYLERAGLLEPLGALGFGVIGYGCTTCGGKSGPLEAVAAENLQSSGIVAAAVLSGNRNFEGRIHKLIRANYIGSPPMVVLYALAGRIDIDFEREPIGMDKDGRPVFLRELWPATEEIEALLPLANDAELFGEIYGRQSTSAEEWASLPAPSGERFPWDPHSTYLVEPPFFRDVATGGEAIARLAHSLKQARVLAAFGDSLTTDHISPSGEIPADTPAGQYLQSLGVAPADFNTYVARRCNADVMTRATFANIRIKNALLPQEEGGYTRRFPDGARTTIFDAAMAYRDEGLASIVLGGKEYGTGSSRDWAAKGSALLGVRAVIAESYERIHRANLVGMGVLPLAFMPGQGWRSLGLAGSELYRIEGVEDAVRHGRPVQVIAQGDQGEIRFEALPQLLTDAERELMAAGGIPAHVLNSFVQATPRCVADTSATPT